MVLEFLKRQNNMNTITYLSLSPKLSIVLIVINTKSDAQWKDNAINNEMNIKPRQVF
jgi:hypothetical protein